MLLDNRRKSEPLTLGDAIRKGAAIDPVRTDYFMGPAEGSCALGAAYLGLGLLRDNAFSLIADGSCYALIAQRFRVSDEVLDKIMDLNDVDGWTREQIADWCDEQLIGVPAGVGAEVLGVR